MSRGTPHSLVLVFFLLVSVTSWAQTPAKIKLLHADEFVFDADGVKARKLIGNVRFKHEGALMFCDSAYLYTEENRMDAYGNVVINQGDSLKLYGDSLFYNGDTRQAKLRGNIRLIDPSQTLNTAFLDYNLASRRAQYYGGGTILNKAESTTIKSEKGAYFVSTKRFEFNGNVQVDAEKYQIQSDTMHYHTDTEKSEFFGPTTITSDSTLIYCEKGYISQADQIAVLTRNAYVQSKEQLLKGDSIYYNQGLNYIEAFQHVSILDTLNDVLILGHYAFYNELDSSSIITDSLELMQLFENDTLFLHADSLITKKDPVSGKQQLFAYHKVRFYKTDLQGKCDSIVFNNFDSTITLFHDPVIWNKANQLTGDTVIMFMAYGEIQKMHLFPDAFVVSEADTGKYNQIKGKILIARFRQSEVHQIDVQGNGQTAYYAQEEDGTWIGINRLDCSKMRVNIDSNTISNIAFFVKPDGTLYPMKDLTPELAFLRNFSWRQSIRPKSRMDIFYWREDTEEE